MDISPASETNFAVGQSRVLSYSERNIALPLSLIKNVVIAWATETDEAQRQALIRIYSTKDIAMALTYHFEPATPVEPPEVDITVGGSRPVGIFGPIMGSEFEIEIDAHIAFTREFEIVLDNSRKAAIPAVIQFASEVPAEVRFSKMITFSIPGTRVVALHYSQVLREDRELIELIESGIL